MKQLDKMYDIIFEHPRLKELFLNVHSSKWKNLSVDEKKEMFIEINSIVANLYGYKENTLKFIKLRGYGAQNAFKWEIFINEDSLATDDGYEVIDTYFHELRHGFQARAVQNKLTDKEYASDEQKKEWKRNLLPGNYFGGESQYYQFQSIEKDAWITGMLFARRIYFMNKEVLNLEDEEWENYCARARENIMIFISDSKESKKIVEEVAEIIDDIYSERRDEIEQLDKGVEYYNELTKLSIESLDFNQIATLLSPYAWLNLDIEKKIRVVKRYCEIVGISEDIITIEENTVGSVKIGDNLHTFNDGYSLVNDALSINFRYIVEAIVEDRDSEFEVDELAKEEIKLNMYKAEDGTLINYVSEYDNYFMYALQPFAKYEAIYVLSQFEKLKQAELESYGKNSSLWQMWERLYNNKMIYAMYTKLTEIEFEDYYKTLIDSYKDKRKASEVKR